MRGVSPQAEATSTGLMVVAAALMTLGVVMALSTRVSLEGSLREAVSWNGPLGRQAVFVVLACSAMLICSRIDPGLLRWRRGWLLQPSLLAFLLSIGLLLAVWMPHIGHASHGRHRWIDLGSVGFQPSEFAKIALVAFLAAMLSRKRDVHEAHRPNPLLPIMGIGLVCVLVGLEDFGTAVLLGAVGGLMLVVGGCRAIRLAIWVIPALGGFAYLLLSHPYRVERLLAFRNVWEDRFGAGYHAIQSLAAIASGGWAGRGLGAGMAQYGYLPEARTDFVFAIICEETGFLGGAAVVLLFVTFVYFGIRTMLGASSSDGGFVRLFAFGLTAMIGLQAVMNIAVVTVVAPTTGIALPFVSAGGSGVLCFGMAAGLLAGVARSGQAGTAEQVYDSAGAGEESIASAGSVATA